MKISTTKLVWKFFRQKPFLCCWQFFCADGNQWSRKWGEQAFDMGFLWRKINRFRDEFMPYKRFLHFVLAIILLNKVFKRHIVLCMRYNEIYCRPDKPSCLLAVTDPDDCLTRIFILRRQTNNTVKTFPWFIWLNQVLAVIIALQIAKLVCKT